MFPLNYVFLYFGMHCFSQYNLNSARHCHYCFIQLAFIWLHIIHFLVVFISLWIVMFLSESIFLLPEELCLLFSLGTGLLVINLLGHCLIREIFNYLFFWRMFSQGISRFVFTSFHHLKDVFHCLLVSSVSGENCWLYESNLTFCSGCF